MLDTIIKDAETSNKNIIIFGSPRSGTHALGSMIANKYNKKYLGEICKLDNNFDPWKDINAFTKHTELSVAQIVQLAAKVKLAVDVTRIKKDSIIISLRRKNKIAQFASWIYFHKTGGVFGKWHNHVATDMLIEKQHITVSQDDINSFLLEQMLDDFFAPDYILYYEDLTFTDTFFKKNVYKFDITDIFSNLEFIEQQLSQWKYLNE